MDSFHITLSYVVSVVGKTCDRVTPHMYFLCVPLISNSTFPRNSIIRLLQEAKAWTFAELWYLKAVVLDLLLQASPDLLLQASLSWLDKVPNPWYQDFGRDVKRCDVWNQPHPLNSPKKLK